MHSSNAVGCLRGACQLGRGHWGEVFLGRSDAANNDGQLVAIKVMPLDEGVPSLLQREADVLSAVGDQVGFPALLHHGRQSVFGRDSDVLVMELLGESVASRCAEQAAPDFCEGRQLNGAGVARIGMDLVRCLRALHAAKYVHNDLKPQNMLFGAPGTAREDHVHLIDFGMVTRPGDERDTAPCEEELEYGGGTPLFASLAEHEGRPTAAKDDLESLWYCLAFLVHGTLPWQWETPDRAANIKRRLFIDGCAIAMPADDDIGDDGCTAKLDLDDCCSTAHCFDTVQGWLDGVPPAQPNMVDAAEAINALWYQVLACNESGDGTVDYDACIEALSGVSANEDEEEEEEVAAEEASVGSADGAWGAAPDGFEWGAVY